ncbi:hypothetical protein AVEN_60200-1 [Araneus ventricosus]|uniref:ATP-dependent DNA helicase n=1 Tax=Araneus ventricosus TaxID=182803 RepID=A0A4Y2CM49_ARAVE|nr:hypothetical protein AVEN_60200-1 [Araneus ventricosus]
MSHKAAFEALDVMLKDIRHNNNIMGDITIMLTGVFRQALPVTPRRTRAEEMHVFLKSSNLSNGIQRFGLTTNMRVYFNGDPSAQQFADNLLGNGAISPDN